MTVKELTDTLKRYPQQATVLIGEENDMCREAKSIHQASFTFADEYGYRYKPIIIK